MKLSWQIVRLQLKETFSISYGNYFFRDSIIVTLSKNGSNGYGEATIIDYYNITSDNLVQEIVQNQKAIENQTIQNPFHFYLFLKSLKISVFLTSALDCAFWDLFGKLENKSFFDLQKVIFSKMPNSSITISAGIVEDQIKKIKELNWPSYKVKFKTFNLDSLLKLQNLDAKIAIDANASFSISDCKILNCPNKTKSFLYVEQPMATGVDNYSHLSNTDTTNWMADEDLQTTTNLFDLKPHYQSVNIKLLKCGGLTPALEIIKNAKKLDFKIMIGCMTESTVGISAAAVLSPFCDFADLDGANLIANDFANGSKVNKGLIEISGKPGLGIELF